MKIDTYFIDIFEYEPESGNMTLMEYFNYGADYYASPMSIENLINWGTLSIGVF